jgi:Uma2 family endonuclease
MATRGTRYLASDIWDAPDEGQRHEVINGELFITVTPGWRHQVQLGQLQAAVSGWVDVHYLGYVVGSLTAVVLDEENGLQPDMLFVSHERAHFISDRGVERPPDLVVEVLSPSTEARDRGLKLRRYAASGVTHYWILDTDGPTIEERVLGDDGYTLVGTFGPGTVFRPTLFPGLEIPLDEIAG